MDPKGYKDKKPRVSWRWETPRIRKRRTRWVDQSRLSGGRFTRTESGSYPSVAAALRHGKGDPAASVQSPETSPGEWGKQAQAWGRESVETFEGRFTAWNGISVPPVHEKYGGRLAKKVIGGCHERQA